MNVDTTIAAIASRETSGASFRWQFVFYIQILVVRILVWCIDDRSRFKFVPNEFQRRLYIRFASSVVGKGSSYAVSSKVCGYS